MENSEKEKAQGQNSLELSPVCIVKCFLIATISKLVKDVLEVTNMIIIFCFGDKVNNFLNFICIKIGRKVV